MKNMNFTYYVGMLCCVLFLTTKTMANDIDLCTYQTSPIMPVGDGNNIQDLSGVTYHSDNLFMVNNKPTVVYKTNLNGTILQTITLNGFDDTEGIVHIGETKFAVAEEKRGKIAFFDIPDLTANIITIDYSDAEIASLSPTLGPWGDNDGLEGVSYNPAMSTIYTVKEKTSIKYYDFPNPVSFPATITNASEFCANDALNFSDIAGVHHLGLNFDGSTEVLLLSQENKTLKHVDENCNVIGEFSLDFMTQPEGVTMDNMGNIYIVGEKDTGENSQLVILSPNPSLDTDEDGICNDDDPCPNLHNDLIGTSCDEDGDCITGKTYDANCNCTGGTFQDADGDNVCDANDICPNGNDNIDTDGDGVPDDCDDCPNLHNDLIGTPCDDGDIYTSGDTYTADCECIGTPVPPTCRYTDSLALVAFYSALSEEGWYEPDDRWDLTQPMDTWFGISLNENGCVESISMSDYDISGTIAPEIGDLSEVKSIHLAENRLSGTIPSSIGNLTNLEFLSLGDNQLSGDIPASIEYLINLKELYLESNELTGNIPNVIGNLTNLEDLSLLANNLSGNIPPEIGSMTSLERLHLSYNQLSGCYDDNLTQLCNQLDFASISEGNNFDVSWEDFCNNGNCEPTCRQIDSLALIAVYDALNGDNWAVSRQWDFTQPMDTWYGITLNGDGCVDIVRLDEDDITGTLAPEIGDLSEITAINLAVNNISGLIPASITNLTSLEYLSLSNNQLTGNIPSEIGSLTNLKKLALSGNQLTGNIPSSIGNLINLSHLYLGANQFGGAIPATIGNLTQLMYLTLNNNMLTGSIPSEINNLTKLIYLYLKNNELTGVLPFMGDLDELWTLQLQNNQITGSMPAWLVDMDELSYLKLHDNQLSGCYDSSLTALCNKLVWYGTNASISDGNNFSVPWEDFCNSGHCEPTPTCRQRDSLALVAVFHAANGNTWRNGIRWDLTQPIDTWYGVTLNDNQCVSRLSIYEEDFGGTLSHKIGELSELTYLDLSENQLGGTIPGTIGNLTNLTFLSLGINNFTGNIPASIGDLTNLTNLYLHRNQFTIIPSAIGDLDNLIRLTLNHNQFDYIPASIGDLTNLDDLNLSNNNLSVIPVAIRHLTNLKTLHLDYNNISSLPSEFGTLPNLENLYIRHNNIVSIPNTIGDLSKLKLLYLSHNNITGINSAIGSLTNLEVLYLNHNNIPGINPAVGDLTNLQELYLSNNKITGINPNLQHLTNLTKLYLSNNQINGTIPVWFGNLEHLTTLKLHNNNMSGCFDSNLSSLCGQLTNTSINYGNNFNIEWEDFCNGATCGGAKIGQNQAIDTHNSPNPFTNQTTITYTRVRRR